MSTQRHSMTSRSIANETGFIEVLNIIQQGRNRAFKKVNIVLIETYWAVGQYLSRKVAADGWGKGVVKELSAWLSIKSPELKGYSASNLWRMMQRALPKFTGSMGTGQLILGNGI